MIMMMMLRMMNDCDDNHQFELTSRSRSSSWKEILSGSWSWWSRRSKGGLNSEHANDEDGGGHVDVDVLTVEVEDMLKVGGSKISMFWWHLVARRGMGSGIAPGLGIGRKHGGDGISTGLSLQEVSVKVMG